MLSAIVNNSLNLYFIAFAIPVTSFCFLLPLYTISISLIKFQFMPKKLKKQIVQKILNFLKTFSLIFLFQCYPYLIWTFLKSDLMAIYLPNICQPFNLTLCNCSWLNKSMKVYNFRVDREIVDRINIKMHWKSDHFTRLVSPQTFFSRLVKLPLTFYF